MRRVTTRCRALALLLGALAAAAPDASAQSQTNALDSVGRLLVPATRYENGYARHYHERCSGTLVSMAPDAASSRLVISAWHCLEDYRDLSRPLLFESPHGETREARVLQTGGGMHSDWALLKLHEPLSHPTLLDLDDADYGEPRAVTMVGYPSVSGQDRANLQLQTDCAVFGRDGADRRSDCALRKGASGGGVFSSDGGVRYLGVISRGDGVTQSIYVPLARFRRQLQANFQHAT